MRKFLYYTQSEPYSILNSVSSLYSVSAVLKPYVRPNAKCLEMFARCLQPDWTSWGNEVIKFQHHSYFTTESIESACGTFTETTDADQQVDTSAINKSACR